MQLCRAPVVSAVSAHRSARPASFKTCAAKTETAIAPATSSDANVADIYIGFPKGDYAPRAGRKGRVIKGDPKAFPDKADFGLFKGVTGGWAGGEAALQKLRDEIKEEQASGSGTTKSKTSRTIKTTALATTPKTGKDAIYVGFGKNELELRKSGQKGRVIYDDATKYPAKEDIGLFSGATGGFAGGEAGLRQFVQTGEVKISKNARGQGISPLETFALVLITSTAGAAVFVNAYDAETGTIKPEAASALQQAAQDAADLSSQQVFGVPVTTAALALLAVGGSITLTNMAIRLARRKAGVIGETAKTAAIYSAFFAAIFLAARAVLES